MSKRLLTRFLGLFGSRTQVGVDKAGNRYFTRMEEVDGVAKEKRWVEFKGEEDPTSVPVEWICWLNGQRKKAPTPEEMAEMEARRRQVRENVELLKKKEEEERKSDVRTAKKISKIESPNLKDFMRQFPSTSLDQSKGAKDAPVEKDDTQDIDRTSEPTGSGPSFKPGTWQPPT